MTPRWPSTLWIVRHGQSAGNVARDAADIAGLERIALDHRDVDVPLSEMGRSQAEALGKWFADSAEQPQILMASPYVRALETATLFRDSGGCSADVPVCLDERLREKEFGILDGLTTLGIRKQMPEQAAFRSTLGKFYHRPPGGESWVDVIFRLRSMLDTISLHHSGKRVMIVAHQVVVLCLRYILEGHDEKGILAIDKQGDIANCGLTEYRFEDDASGGQLVLTRFNIVAPLVAEDAPVTTEADHMVAARG